MKAQQDPGNVSRRSGFKAHDRNPLVKAAGAAVALAFLFPNCTVGSPSRQRHPLPRQQAS